MKKFSSRQKKILYLVFFFSGASSLLYEISWNRQIGLLFGHTAQSSGLILTIYFFGMAIGYWWASKFIDQKPNPLFNYAVAEIFIGVWSFFVPTLLKNVSLPIFSPFLNHPDSLLRIFWRMFSSFVLLLPATIAIGYSLPAFAKAIAFRQSSPSASIINSYALNTLGAFCGVLFSLIGLLCFGVIGCNYFAATLSIVCGLVALYISGYEKERNLLNVNLKETFKISPILYGMAFFSGFSILSLEVIYTHLFALVSHNSTYNFSATLCSFLLSLSLGSFIAKRFSKKKDILIWICFGVSITIPPILKIFSIITKGELFAFSENFLLYFFSFFFTNFLFVFPPIALAGMILPVCWGTLSENQGKTIGILTYLNTFSAAIGALFTTFLFIPLLGIYNSLFFFSVLYWFVFLFLSLHFNQKQKKKYLLKLFLGTVLFFCFSFLLSKQEHFVQKGAKSIWKKETPYGPIEVFQEFSSSHLKMTQNQHYVLGSSKAEVREKRQAHLPLLLHSSPKRVAFLGMGTGLTINGALQHQEIKHIDVIELIPEVKEAAKLFHQKKENHLFNDPRVHIAINDARHYLYQQDEKYDVLISDLFVPWHSFTGYLYTVEHYQIAFQRLNQKGLYCQWLPLYQLGEKEFQMIADSFASVFPFVSLWRGEKDNKYPLIALIGTKQPLRIQFNKIKQRLKKISSTKRVDVKLKKGSIPLLLPEDKFLYQISMFFSLYVGEWLVRDKKMLNTDEFPRVEFLAPITQRKNKLLQNKVLKEYYDNILSHLPKKHILKK